MKLLNFNWRRTRSILQNDAQILMSDTHGHSVTTPKALIIGTSLAFVSALFLLSMAKASMPAAAQPVQYNLPLAVPSTASLYDFRSEKKQGMNVNSAVRLTLKPGQSLGPLLQKHNVDPNAAYAATQAFATVYSPKNLRVGQAINLYFNPEDNSFSGLTLKPNPDNTVFVERSRSGGFTAKKITAEFSKELVRVKSEIKNSLYLDAQSLGAPDKVIVQFSQIYAHSVDFQRDIRTGDKFEMLFEIYRDHNGNTVKAGDLIFTSFSPRGKTSSFYLFKKDNGREGYYDAKGKGAKRMLMRTPVNGARLSSRYGTRRHPVLGYRKKHKGVDFAAPRGTPIMAAGSGTITHAGRYGTYGNYLRIRHTDGYSTAYAHMSKYARGSKIGRRVIQGQTVGYVGATGRVTGAHLHYEVLKNGRQINPMSLSTLSGKPLKKAELPAFKTRAAQIDKLRANLQIKVPTKPELSAETMPSPNAETFVPYRR